MKYITALFIAIAAFAFVGCEKKADTKPTPAVITVPTFKNEKVNAYLRDYAAYCESAETAFKDPAVASKHAEAMADFAKRQQDVVKLLQGSDEIAAFNKCIDDIRQHLEKALHTK